MLTIADFQKKKLAREKMSLVTCYDFWSAQILNTTAIDALLIGDSLAMIMHGHNSTLPASTDLMALHCAAVVKGAPNKFLIGDLPFLSYRKSLTENMNNVEKIMQTGVHSVKLEGAAGNLELVSHLVESGVPVMGHIGLTPQSLHQLGGFKVQGREEKSSARLVDAAKALEDAGCFSIVLECVPAVLAEKVSLTLHIPTIGIGAGSKTDGQILVLQDMLGMNPGFQPKFLRHYLKGSELVSNAINSYCHDVKEQQFPSDSESYT